MQLSILCVTFDPPRAEPFKRHFRELGALLGAEVVIAVDGRDVKSAGYIESCLDDAIALTHGDYILRLDDDEKCSSSMVQWLQEQRFLEADHWSFPRVHLWGNPQQAIMEEYYFPDLQTRLSVRAKSGGRPVMHQGSPHGGGTIARVCLEHWTYLAKSYEERQRIAEFYGKSMPGTGRSIEDEHPAGLQLIEYTDGAVPMKGRMWKTGPIK